MNITYTWKILELERNSADGGVVTAHWNCTGVDADTEESANIYGTDSFQPDATDPDFISFESLTEEDVLGWIWAKEDFDKEGKEAAIAGQIDAKLNPVVSKGLPW